jgi:hypothetical protein
MYKIIFMTGAAIFMAGSAFAQTNPQLEKAVRDPKRAENSAKADVYIHKKEHISDSVQSPTATITKTETKKKRSCKRNATRS